MISSSLKQYVERTMNNREVVEVTNRPTNNMAMDSNNLNSSPSIEDLRKKYLSSDYRVANPSDSSSDSNVNKSNNDDDVEVALLRKKNFEQDSNNDDADQRTIINSLSTGIIGSQG